jgi:hypothetical protein
MHAYQKNKEYSEWRKHIILIFLLLLVQKYNMSSLLFELVPEIHY